jgi:glyoxylase-like metal-dependent hydrolase (beta-lactamase superfamily II)
MFIDFRERSTKQKQIRCIIFAVLIFSLLLSLLLVTSCSKSPDEGSSEETFGGHGSSSTDSDSSQVTTSSIKWPEKIEPTSVDMELKKISENTYFVEGPPGTPTDNEGFMSNAGVVVTKDGVVVFDALGTPSLAYKMLSLISAITNQPVKKVIISHYHADHIYGLQVLKDMGAEIIAPMGARDYLASDAAQGRLKERRESLFPWVDENTRVVEPDIYLDKDTSFTLGGVDFEIVSLGSTHSEGDLMLRVLTDQVLFSGDLVFEGRIPFVAGSNPDVWMKRLSEFNIDSIKFVVPGHGGMSTNPVQALQFTRQYLGYLHDTMQQAVDNLVSFDEAYSAAEWSGYEKLPAFQANRMNAYYVFLKLEALSMQ